jgi:Tol biopolymer transport system component
VYPWISPDGTQLTYGSNRSGSFDVWVRDLTTGKEMVAVPRYSFPSLPTFTKDGLRITFQGTPRWRWLSVPVPGTPGARSSTPQLVCDDCESFWDLSSDGKWALFGSEKDTVINVREIATGRTVELMRLTGEVAGRFRISPDDRWAAFNDRVAGSIRIYVAPFQTNGPIARERWIPFTPEGTLVNAATWSPSGDALYYLSDADGFFCVWRQALDRATGRPSGDATAVWHLHEARISMSRLPMPVRGLAVSRDRVVLSASESAGNVWLAK